MQNGYPPSSTGRHRSGNNSGRRITIGGYEDRSTGGNRQNNADDRQLQRVKTDLTNQPRYDDAERRADLAIYEEPGSVDEYRPRQARIEDERTRDDRYFQLQQRDLALEKQQMEYEFMIASRQGHEYGITYVHGNAKLTQGNGYPADHPEAQLYFQRHKFGNVIAADEAKVTKGNFPVYRNNHNLPRFPNDPSHEGDMPRGT